MCPITFIRSHIETETSCLMDNSSGYNCPQCGSRYCELPVECKQCGLTLVSAPHLARSCHHLFHIKPFIERAKLPETTYFALRVQSLLMNRNGCKHGSRLFGLQICHFTVLFLQVYECETCNQIVCLDCDLFIREILHICPVVLVIQSQLK